MLPLKLALICPDIRQYSTGPGGFNCSMGISASRIEGVLASLPIVFENNSVYTWRPSLLISSNLYFK